MPGNEVGDGLHNFFVQENLSQGQHQPQAVGGSWHGLSNTLWAGSQRQINVPFSPNLRNCNVQQSDSELGHGVQSSQSPRVRNFMQSTFQPDLARSHPQSQQPVLSGYVHGHQIFQARQNEADNLEMDAESDKHNLVSRGYSVPETQQGNGPDPYKKNLMRLEPNESHVSYNFFGGQQQMSGQHAGMMQPISKQNSGISDRQLLQQEVMYRQMQELQRQQLQRQQQEAREQSSVKHVSGVANRATGNQTTTLINGVPMHDASNYSWPSDIMATNSNWLHRGTSAVMQGPSTGHMSSPQHSQAQQLMGLIPQQVDQSFYGSPVASTRGNLSEFSQVQQISCDNSFQGNNYSSIPEQASKQQATVISRQGYQENNMFGPSQIPNRGINLGNLQVTQEESTPAQDFRGRQEKEVLPVAPSQNVATLDPTEEKILFGSDDSLWDAFGSSAGLGMGGCNTLDSTDSAFPSIPSGTWSALMQSAVAESSSGDTGLQEEWSGLSLHNTKPQTGNPPTLAISDSGKPHLGWPDRSLYNTSTLNMVPLSGGAGPSTSYGGVSTNEHRRYGTRPDQVERLQYDSSQRSMHQVSAEGSNQSSLKRGPAQRSNIPGNVANSSDGYSFLKSNSASWDHEKSAGLCNFNDQRTNTPDRWNLINPLSSGGMSVSIGRHVNEVDGAIKDKIADGAYGSKMDYASSSNIGGPQSNRRNSSMDGVSSLANANNMRTNPESSQELMHNDNLDFWKQVDPSVSSRGSFMSKSFQPNMETGSHNFILSENNFSDKGTAARHEVDDYSKKENSSDSLHSNASQHASTGLGRKENVWVDAGDSRHLLGGKEKFSSQVGRRPPGIRKFQYHPMGDLDVDEECLYGSRQAADSQAMHQQVSKGLKSSNQGSLGQSKFGKNSMEVYKDHVPTCQEEPKALDENPSKSMLPAYQPDASAGFDRSAVNSSSRNSDKSQKMLELLHKVDQSKEHGTARKFEIPEAEKLNRNAGYPQQNLSSLSQNFGLQLAPPSQRLQVRDQDSFSLPENSHSSAHVSSGALFQANNTASAYNMQGSKSAVSNSGFPYPRNYLQNQSVTSGSGQVNMHQYPSLPVDRQNNQSKQIEASYERDQILSLESVPEMCGGARENDAGAPLSNFTNQTHAGVSSPEFPVLEAAPLTVPSKSSPNLGYNVPSQQFPLCLQTSDLSHSHSQSNSQDRNFSGVQKPNDQLAQGQNVSYDSDVFNSQGAREEKSMSASDKQHVSAEAHLDQKAVDAAQGGTALVNHLLDASPSNPATTKRDIEAFGRSLKPNNISKKFSLLHQMQSMKNSETGSGEGSGKRFKVCDGALDNRSVASAEGQQLFNYNAMAKDTSANMASVRSLDDRRGILLPEPGDKQNTNTSTDTCVQNSLQKFPSSDKNAFVRGDYLQVSPQMAPSWFDQYGTFRNGQMLPTYDAQKSGAVKAVGKASEDALACSTLGKMNSAVGASELGNIHQTSNSEHSPQPLPEVNHESLVVQSHKRKNVTSKLLPWFKEVVQGDRKLQAISMAEAEWAQATNRLTEKVEDDTDVIEDGPPFARSKRRLILTTQLMQQLLHPSPPSIFSGDFCNHYENVAYFTARLAVGDACSSISSLGKHSSLSCKSGNLPSEKVKESNLSGLGPDDFSKVAEDFIGRAKNLENNLLRLETGVSILDLRLECEDLEKFSVINRFAKFHSRPQSDGADMSVASNGSSNLQKQYPQRYVTALPMPRNLPDRAQCISL